MPKSFLITNKRYTGAADDVTDQLQQQCDSDADRKMEQRGPASSDQLEDCIPSPTDSVTDDEQSAETDIILDVCTVDDAPAPSDLRSSAAATTASPLQPFRVDYNHLRLPAVTSPLPSDALAQLYARAMAAAAAAVDCRTQQQRYATAAASLPDPRLTSSNPFHPSLLYPFSHPSRHHHHQQQQQHHPEDRILMPLVHKLLVQHRTQMHEVAAAATAAGHIRGDRPSPASADILSPSFASSRGGSTPGFDSDSMDDSATAADRSPTGPCGASLDAFLCGECGRAYSTASNLARHRQSHRLGIGSTSSGSTSSSSSCSPPVVDDRRGSLLLDLPGSPPAAGATVVATSRKCPHCDKTYSSAPAYSMHVRTHSQGCACPQCGKRFSRPWLLQGHIRTHTGEKPFRCPHCGKTFADKSNLRAHIQTHSPDKPHVCGRCGKAFALRSYLYKHEESSCMRSHRLYHGYPYLRPPPASAASQRQQVPPGVPSVPPQQLVRQL